MSLWGKRDIVADKPKFANTNASFANQSVYGNTYGVSTTEAVHASTKVKGIHAGWVNVKAYKDNHGNLRYKAETLVAGSDIASGNAYTATVAIAGTVSVTSGQKTVTGVGTSFNSALTVGNSIRIGTTTPVNGTVASIANNTSLQLAVNATSSKTANTLYKLVANTTYDDTDTNVFFQGN